MLRRTSPATTAVSARKTRPPSTSGIAPSAASCSRSVSVQPPSGPTASQTEGPFQTGLLRCPMVQEEAGVRPEPRLAVEHVGKWNGGSHLGDARPAALLGGADCLPGPRVRLLVLQSLRRHGPFREDGLEAHDPQLGPLLADEDHSLPR